MSASGLPSQTGSGSSQWRARAEAGGGGSVRAAGLLPRGVGARAPPLDSALCRRPAPRRTRPLLNQAAPQPRPVASTPPALSRPVSYSGRRGPGPDGSVQRRLQGQSLAGWSLLHRLRREARLRGRRATARGPSPPSPLNSSAQLCGPGSGASESHRSGPVACFLLGSGRCFVDFVCVPVFLRPPSSGRRGRRQLLAAAPLVLASPARPGPRVRG